MGKLLKQIKLRYIFLTLAVVFAAGVFYFLNSFNQTQIPPAQAQSTVYFYWNAENHPCDGSVLPNPPFWTQDVPYRGHVICEPTPNGNRFFEFQTVNNQNSAYTEIYGQGLPAYVAMGSTYYLAHFFNFTRINGQDIWHESGDSADKGLEISGTGVRWVVGRGHWGNLVNNQDHRYTVWGGNPTYRLNQDNPAIVDCDIYVPNRSGYTKNNTMQLEYERWYSCVMAVKMATDNTGSFTVWINGIKIIEYTNIKTVATGSGQRIERITMGGTIAQPAYDAPAHKRQFDALLLTDNWQEIVNRGYLSDPSQSPSIYLLPDLTKDKVISQLDFDQFKTLWGTIQGDFNSDSKTDSKDFGIMMSKWGSY